MSDSAARSSMRIRATIGICLSPSRSADSDVPFMAVAEAAAIGMPHEVKGEVAWLFCVARPGATVDDDVARDVGSVVGDALGKAFRPDRVVFVSALPKTRSAKIVRRAVRARALGNDPGDLSSLENPEALDEISRLLA